jgi:anthranilate synthase component 1
MNSRYDILFAFPAGELRLSSISELTVPGDIDYQGSNFMEALDSWWKKTAQNSLPEQPSLPFEGGWFLYLGYELAGQIEPSLNLQHKDPLLPVAFAVRIPAAIIQDKKLEHCFLIAEEDSSHLLDEMEEDINNITAKNDTILPEFIIDEEDPQIYISNVRRIKEYIREGDVFQVNLSRKWQALASHEIDLSFIYRQLRERNPAPFAGIVKYKDTSILCSSPERLVSVRNNIIETRPIAGTRPRGKNPEDDAAFSNELLGHPKERAEHIMLIDLERNDLGRVCEPGSIKVNELMTVESYAHVHHIVSNVRGTLRSNITPGNIIAAVFPGGTITGCPKVRCMNIISELEDSERGAYTGSMGYLNRNGDIDLNILIRTMVAHKNQISFRAGAGIVADSIPENEVDETRNKAKGMLLSLCRKIQ